MPGQFLVSHAPEHTMPATATTCTPAALAPSQLRLTIDPASLGFHTTADIAADSVPWIGQERAATAAQFGLNIAHPNYHLFVLGEPGSGRASLLQQAMQAAASTRPVPPDLCYLHPPLTPERPIAVHLPSGQGQVLQSAMTQLCETLVAQLPNLLYPLSSQQLTPPQKNHPTTQADTTAAQRTAIGPTLQAAMLVARIAAADALKASAPLRQWLADVEKALLDNAAVFDLYSPPPSNIGLPATPSKPTLVPIAPPPPHPFPAPSLVRKLAHNLHPIRPLPTTAASHKKTDNSDSHRATTMDTGDDTIDSTDTLQDRQEALADWLAGLQVHIAVSHHGTQGAPVVIEDNPSPRSLFGCIENPPDSDMLPDVSCLRPGSLHQAHGGFLMLHLRDVMASEGLWDRLRRFLRNRRLQFDDASTSAVGNPNESGSSQHLQPQAIEANVKIVLIGSVDAYYELHEHDPETARRFQAKVDFADSLAATPASYRAIATLVAHTCQQYQLPPLSAAAVARILEYTHREAEDQHRQTALLGQVQTLLVESATAHHLRSAAEANTNGIAGTSTPTPVIEAADIDAALKARALRHNYPEEQLLDSITEGERLITLHGSAVGQINALTQVDLGDHRFGLPVRITARTYAGHEGLLNIEREVDMSGPIHDKGVLILHSYLTALFSHMAPLALNASIVFEQEYSGVEGDSASCAELYALLSSLSGLPLQQNIAVTGALNQHGEVLPVGGINDKIEGWFNVCQQAGLTGTQGVLIPARNQRHLMLSPTIQNAVARGQFQVYAVHHVSEGIALLTGEASGMQAAAEGQPSPADQQANEDTDSAVQTVLSLAQATLHRFRRACQSAAHTRAGRRGW